VQIIGFGAKIALLVEPTIHLVDFNTIWVII
jgi:hypothetical protein